LAEAEKGIKLTKTIVDKLKHIAGKTQTFYRDNDLKGFSFKNYLRWRQKFHR